MTGYKAVSNKQCQTCEEDFVPRRSDAKFCSIKCKNAFNNHRHRAQEAERQKIVGEANEILWKNRCILFEYLDETVSLSTLKALGFDPTYRIQSKTIDSVTHLRFYDMWCFAKKENQIKIYKHE